MGVYSETIIITLAKRRPKQNVLYNGSELG